MTIKSLRDDRHMQRRGKFICGSLLCKTISNPFETQINMVIFFCQEHFTLSVLLL